jgi:hypothetical protein
MKKYIDLILINLIALIAGLLLYFLTGEKVEILAAILVTGISLSLGLRQYRTENDKLFKELFKEFNEKYDVKFNAVLNNIDSQVKLNKDYQLTQKEEALIIDYLNFCSEEYLWFSLNRIPSVVWNSWENGMVYFLNLPPIHKVVLKQKDQMTSFYGLWDKIGWRINKVSN